MGVTFYVDQAWEYTKNNPAQLYFFNWIVQRCFKEERKY